METWQQALAELDGMEWKMIPVRSIRTDPNLQSRDPRVVASKDRRGVESAGKDVIRFLQSALEANPLHQARDPIRVAMVEGKRLVIDGHHRLNAYRKAGRSEIPARVAPFDMRTATMVSKLVNLEGGVQVPHPDQRRESLWQLLCATGRIHLPAVRSPGGPFDVSKTTVASMMKVLKAGVDPSDYLPDDISTGTGYPRWKAVLRKRRKDYQVEEDVPIDRRIREEAEAQLARLHDLADEVQQAMLQIAKEERAHDFAQLLLEEMGAGEVTPADDDDL